MYSPWPTYRQGRSYAVDHSKSNGCEVCLFGFVCCVIFIAIPIFCYNSELEFRDRLVAFDEVENNIRTTDHCKSSPSLSECLLAMGSSFPLHLTSDSRNMKLSGSVTDSAFGVVVNDALEIQRNTEYCQWDEHTTESCDKCTRQGSDGNDETYDCNCIKTYHYVKTWRSHRVNSLLFDQPGAHYNPQRDPYPSAVFPSINARIGDVPIRSAVLRNTHSHLRAAARFMEWTRTGAREPTFFDGLYRFFGFTLGAGRRYEAVTELEGVRMSEATKSENFVYVGQGGYFFSPHVASQTEFLLKMFVEVLEGSILDFQVGDFMPSCTAGDIRVSFQVRDPREVSVMSGMAVPLEAGEGSVYLDVFKTSKDYELGVVQEGTRNAFDMMAFELRDAKWWCFWGRLALVLWGMMALPMVSAAAGRLMPHATAFWAGAVGLAGCLLALIWAGLWGVEADHSWHEVVIPLLLVGSAGLVVLAERQSQRASQWGFEGVMAFFMGNLTAVEKKAD